MFEYIVRARNNYIFRRYPTTKQFVKFCIIGVSNTIIDFSIYFTLTRTFTWWEKHFLFANATAFLCAVTWSFIANKFWTFRDIARTYHTQYPTFILIYIVGLVVSQSILYFLVSMLHIFDIYAKLIAVVIVVFWNFMANKAWTFNVK